MFNEKETLDKNLNDKDNNYEEEKLIKKEVFQNEIFDLFLNQFNIIIHNTLNLYLNKIKFLYH